MGSGSGPELEPLGLGGQGTQGIRLQDPGGPSAASPQGGWLSPSQTLQAHRQGRQPSKQSGKARREQGREAQAAGSGDGEASEITSM